MSEGNRPGTFTKGDKRINKKGRPKTFDALRALAQEIAHEVIVQKDGTRLTVTQGILRKWAGSNDPRLQMQFMDIAFGKVPQPQEITGAGGQSLEIVITRDKGTHQPDKSSSGTNEGDEGSETI